MEMSVCLGNSSSMHQSIHTHSSELDLYNDLSISIKIVFGTLIRSENCADFGFKIRFADERPCIVVFSLPVSISLKLA